MNLWRNAYKSRLQAEGNNVVEAIKQTTKNANIQQILSSPTRTDVTLNDEDKMYPCIVSDINTFKKRRFLFLPDTKIDVGNYIHHEGYTYLATDKTTSDTYPQLIAEVCNDEFPITSTITKIEKGKDRFGKPVYEEIVNHTYVPCLVESSYSKSSDVDSFPIPSGRIEISLPYQITDNTKYNFTFNLNGDNYSVKDLDLVNVINGIGYMKIIAEKVV